jgi:glutamine amidotransferase
MCRFLCYVGPEVLMADLLYRPKNSLILQSYQASDRPVPLNGDGFGVGWYTPAVSPTPGVFKSITPAWNNRNLQSLAGHVSSPLFFAHVRAASPGMRVSEENCHPFAAGRYLWMHNGAIRGFDKVKRRLRESLPDPVYNAVEGTTDSEHTFAVFLGLLGDADRRLSAKELGGALVETIRWVEHWTEEAGVTEPSYFNFAVTDGESVAAVRYVSDPLLEPASLYYSAGKKYGCGDGVCRFDEGAPSDRSVIIASERLTEVKSDWTRVAPNHVLTVGPGLEVSVELMDAVYRPSALSPRSAEILHIGRQG